MILQIALGIVLAVFILTFLDLLGWLALVAMTLAIIVAALLAAFVFRQDLLAFVLLHEHQAVIVLLVVFLLSMEEIRTAILSILPWSKAGRQRAKGRADKRWRKKRRALGYDE